MPFNIKQQKHLDPAFRPLTDYSVPLGRVSLPASLLAWTLARGAKLQADSAYEAFVESSGNSSPKDKQVVV